MASPSGYPRKEAAEFQKSPVRGRPKVNQLVPKKLTRSTTDDTQTAINRVVHEAMCRADASDNLKEEVLRRVELVIEAKEDELKGRITHQQRLELIRLVATLSVDESMQELARMQQSAASDAEQKVKRDTSVAPVIWRRILCSHILDQRDVMTVGSCCRFLRQDHALGLHRLVLPSLLEKLEDPTLAPLSTQPKPMPSTALKEIVYKFRYAQTLIASRRSLRLHDADFELLKVSQLQRLDLSFCRNLSQENLLPSLRSCFCLQDLSLRGCTQLTTPNFEETLEGLKSLHYLDLRGCENLNTDSVVTVAAELRQLRSLRFGFECQQKLWPFGAKIPMKCWTLTSWDTKLPSLRHLELDLILVEDHPEGKAGLQLMLNEGILALLKLKFLDVLLLWNVLCLQPATFRAIVQRFQPLVDGFMLEDCYHEQEAYFHVVPSNWKLKDRFALDDFAAEAFLPASTTNKRRILTAVNVSRDPLAAIQAMVTPVAELCELEDVILLDENVPPPLDRLASSKVRSLEVRFTPNTWQDFFRDFLCPFIRASPELRRVRLDMGQHFYARHVGSQYDALLKELAGCPNLEEIEFVTLSADEWPQNDRSHPVAEYFDGAGPKTNKVVVASLESLEKLLQSCRRLRQVKLLPPCMECRMSFWRLISAFDLPWESLEFLHPNDTGVAAAAQEVAELPRIVETISPAKFSVNFGMSLTPTICDAVMSLQPLRSLRVERVPYNDNFFTMFAMLPAHSPTLQELALGHMKISSRNELPFMDALCGFHHLRLLRLRALEADEQTLPLKDVLPRLVQQNRRTLQTLYLEDLDSKTLLSCIAGCRNLLSLEVGPKSEAATTGRPCDDFPGNHLEMYIKVIARCPKLKDLQLAMTESPMDGDMENKMTREILQMGRGLQNFGCVNVDLYRGLQYNDGTEEDPNRISDNDDNDSD